MVIPYFHYFRYFRYFRYRRESEKATSAGMRKAETIARTMMMLSQMKSPKGANRSWLDLGWAASHLPY